MKMKSVMLTVFCVTLLASFFSVAQASESTSVMRYILKNKSGDIYRVSPSLAALSAVDRQRLGRMAEPKCFQQKEDKKLELTLELKTMMVHLSLRSKPVTLTELEKQRLASVPSCQVYLPLLKVLSQIISGDDYIGEKELAAN